ncbi:Mu transposase C-terminal domain-containing protein [Leptolyngbya boryana CZ1]|uniref:Mu transposase C-terminal domain-containing protein n=1 Tax=Leptolyngbya boryana CZ1 TaxID=3060204 RepID=A0AA96WYH4_LEPBY|nr:Mu transposase C-terminal domain-containing protein [Leptolyngbya boryana]WNZ47518.1 Mu transposase C-terminal domain-containing protein [Leptolyngbya boryana CZ1]
MEDYLLQHGQSTTEYSDSQFSERNSPASNTIVSDLDETTQRKLEVLQKLIEPCDRFTYGQKLRESAEKLGVSVRQVQRLLKGWEKEGLAAIAQKGRADKGRHRIGEFWETFIIKTYQEGNKGSKRMSPKQVAVRVQAKAREIGDEKPPTYRTVLRVLKPIIERQEKAKSIRSPGWRGSTLSVKTRQGEDIPVEYSNHVWQCDHTPVDVLLVDQYGELLSRPWLTTVIDTYSRCIIGVNLGFDAPSSQVVALALRHAILPKHYGAEYKLNCEWGTYGKPQYFYTDGGNDFRSNHVQQIATDLGFVCHLRHRPSEGGVVERPFRTLNEQLFSTLPGYTGSNVQERPEDAEKDARLTLRELEQLIVRFICDRYNQSIDARMGDQTRFQRWEAGLPNVPDVIDERQLDICLMKATRRSVQRGGYLQFENLMYRGEYLAGYAGETISLRFDPTDITTVLVYRQEDKKEVFLTRAYAQGLETEQLSLEEAKASSRRLRQAGKALSNEAILQEALERDALVAKKKSRKERQKEEQKLVRSQPEKIVEQETDQPCELIEAEPGIEMNLGAEAFAPIDFDELRDGW